MKYVLLLVLLAVTTYQAQSPRIFTHEFQGAELRLTQRDHGDLTSILLDESLPASMRICVSDDIGEFRTHVEACFVLEWLREKLSEEKLESVQ